MLNKKIKFFVFLGGYLLYPLSFIVPRSKKKWTFGSFKNAFTDNAKYLFIYASENYPQKDIAWISADKETVKKIKDLGFKAYFIGSFKGYWHAVSSKYWFFNCYTSDILFFASGNAVCTNLWHGLPMKKIEFNISSGKLADRYVKKTWRERFYHPECFRRPDYLVSTTPFQSEMFAKAFRINLSQCLNIAYPRNVILQVSEEERRAFIKKYEPVETLELIEKLKQYDKVYIYMPTWRDSQKDIFSANMDLNVLNNSMKSQNGLFVLKPHANTEIDKTQLSGYSNVLLVDNKSDIYTILPYTHVLITDYSSILYDYILMDNKDLILYLYDYEEYISNNRDFNFPFFENVVGKAVYNFDALAESIQSNDFQIDNKKRNEIILKFWGEKNENNICEMILDKVCS